MLFYNDSRASYDDAKVSCATYGAQLMEIWNEEEWLKVRNSTGSPWIDHYRLKNPVGYEVLLMVFFCELYHCTLVNLNLTGPEFIFLPHSSPSGSTPPPHFGSD